MQTLQTRLRQLRSWQHTTIYSLSQLMPGMRIDVFPRLEGGDGKAIRAQLNPISRASDPDYTIKATSAAYGLTVEAFRQMLEDEAEWRMCAATGNLDVLPRIARYIYRPLPEVARALFERGEFVVLDLETTSQKQHEPTTEVVEACILDHTGEVLLNSLIKPCNPIPNSDLHGITDEMTMNAPTFRDIYPEIVAAISGKVVVIYNADYDAYLLDNLFISHGFDMPIFDQYCLMREYADFYKAPGKFGNYAWQSLFKACDQQGVILNDAHRAYGDTMATYSLLKALANK